MSKKGMAMRLVWVLVSELKADQEWDKRGVF
jgi:hypothetical protein